MAEIQKIVYYDRTDQDYMEEIHYASKLMTFLNRTYVGQSFTAIIASNSLFSNLMGMFCNSSLSKYFISNFVNKFGINSNEYECKKPFGSFNDFFTRRFKPGKRTFERDENKFPSPVEGKILCIENISRSKIITIKGTPFSLSDLLQDPFLADQYENGLMLIFRLYLPDYHWFHFPDTGEILDTRRLGHTCYSVTPISTHTKKSFYSENIRTISILQTDHFGEIILVEIGGFLISSIKQVYIDTEFKRGQPKGFFKVGGSTVVTIFKKGQIHIDKDILEQSRLGIETHVKLGMGIGIRKQ